MHGNPVVFYETMSMRETQDRVAARKTYDCPVRSACPFRKGVLRLHDKKLAFLPQAIPEIGILHQRTVQVAVLDRD